MIRVAFVTGGVPLGGSTTFTFYLASALRALGVRAEVFSFTANNPLAKEFSEAGVPVHVQDEKRIIYEDRLQLLYRELRIFDPSVVISVLGVESFEMLQYLPSGVLRIGVVHDMAIRPHVFIPHYSHTMDHVVVVAQYLVQEIMRSKDHPPVTYIQHGIPIPSNIAPREPNPNGPLRLIYYGRLEDVSKGVRMFPKIASALKRHKVHYTWTIQGTGPEENYLRHALAPEIQEGTVRFAAPVAYEILPSIVRQHDVYILTSTNEGGPLTLLEAMALGLVPLCGDIPSLIQEVITPDNGFRVPRAEADAYAERISALDADRDLLERMSAAANRTITATFSHESMARRYLKLFDSLAKPDRSGVWSEKIIPVSLSGMTSPFGRALRRLGKRLPLLRNLKR